jgi:DNA-binding GntR family transcriptional regulator
MKLYKLKQNQSLGEQAKENIVNMIVSGKIKPGDKLKETEIAAQMGISRIPVRDALLLLEKEGFVVSGPHKNSVVADINYEELVKVLLPVRITIETYAMEKFLEIAEEEHFEYLDYQINSMNWALQNGNRGQFVEADIQFHECILRASGLLSLLSIWSGIANRMRMYFMKSVEVKKDKLSEVIVNHKELLELMRRRDKKKALMKLLEHLNEIVI